MSAVTGADVAGMPKTCAWAAILTAEALAFVADLERRFGPRRLELLRAPRRAPAPPRRRRAARLPRRDARGARGRLDDRPRSRRSAGPPGRDHRPDRPEDDDQRPQLGRDGVHGRLRGRELADLAQHGRGPGEPRRRRSSGRSSSRARRARATASNDDVATLLVRPRGWHLLERHCPGRTASRSRPSLFDFGLYFFHNGRSAARARQRPVLLPAEAGEPPRGAALERASSRMPRRRSACRRRRSGRRC